MGADEIERRETSDDQFIESFRKTRIARGLSQGDITTEMVARGFDWNQTTVSKVERGQRRVTVGEGIELAQIVGSTVEALGATDTNSVDYQLSTIRSEALFAVVAAREGNIALGSLAHAIDELDIAIRRLDALSPNATWLMGSGAKTAEEMFSPLLDLQPAIERMMAAINEIALSPDGLEMLEQVSYSADKLRYEWAAASE